MKKCNNPKCIHKGKSQPFSNFYWRNDSNNYRSKCKDCCRTDAKEYSKTPNGKEVNLRAGKVWREKNPEYSKNWKKENPEYDKNFRKKNRQKINRQKRKLYHKNKLNKL